MCKKIHRGGNAEQYHADKKYKEAVAVAVEACADDVKGQTCFICTQALHWKTKEGLVRGCACRGTAGFAHVSCLAEQAKILFEEAVENNWGEKVVNERWARWYSCSLCEQRYHGDVKCALGWACWKTYAGRPETDWARRLAIEVLGNGLFGSKDNEAALSVQLAELAMKRRLGSREENILVAQNNLANTYEKLGLVEEALSMRQEVYSGRLKLYGEENERTLISANNYASTLVTLERFEEAKSVLRKTMPVARRVLGEGNDLTLRLRWNYAKGLYKNSAATLDDLREAVNTLEDAGRTARQVLGGAHPLTEGIEGDLRRSSRAILTAATRK